MGKNQFGFRVNSLSYGWSEVVLRMNEEEVAFDASYLAEEPLASLIDSCHDMIFGYGLGCVVKWESEPGKMEVHIVPYRDGMVRIDVRVRELEDMEDGEEKSWRVIVQFDDFVRTIVSEALRVLKSVGLCGYMSSWKRGIGFPLAQLIDIAKKLEGEETYNKHSTDIIKEAQFLQKLYQDRRIKEEVEMEECTVFYEAWQMQCCGEPFAVGERVKWTCKEDIGHGETGGIVIDLEEEHHVGATHVLRGEVRRIRAIRTEEKTENGSKSENVIVDELQRADGWESEKDSDESTRRSFDGYVVDLKNVNVMTIEAEEKRKAEKKAEGRKQKKTK